MSTLTQIRTNLFPRVVLPNSVESMPFLLRLLLIYNADAVINQQGFIKHKSQTDSIDRVLILDVSAFESIADEMFKA